MKRLFSLTLVLAMCLLLIACAGERQAENASETESTTEAATEPTTEPLPTKDELLSQAEKASANDINNAAFDNIARTKQTYCNKTLELSGMVKTIQEDYVELAGFYGATYLIDVYLPLDDLVKLDAGQQITVVGNTTDELIDTSESVAEYTFEYKHFQMPIAYLVQDRMEIKGVLKGVNNSYAPAYNIQIGTSNVLKLVYFADTVDTSSLAFNQEITFSARAINVNDSWRYYDAEIIE
ncbi:MAG: hypothetical protein IJ744_03880 [Lachnospiraceae bacterium]|nr:hypothetical protein [Lachnospiraceae bacterium]